MKKYICPYHKGNEIADICSEILGEEAPYELKFAQSAEEYIFAYETGPSTCMTFKDSSTASIQELLTNGSHPACWYHYTEEIVLAYLKKGSKCIARTLVRKDKLGKLVNFGKTYAINTKIKEVLIELLNKQKLSYDNKFTLKKSFTSPAICTTINSAEVYISPFPYQDNISNAFYIEFDEDKIEFMWTPVAESTLKREGHSYGTICKHGLVWSGKSTIGFVNSADCKSISCGVCNNIINKHYTDHGPPGVFANPPSERNKHLVAEDGTIFCDAKCKQKAKYVWATRADKTEVLVPAINVISDPVYPMKFFTTKHSVKENGGIPFLLHPSDDINLEYLTVSPDVIKIKKISGDKLVECGLFASSFFSTLEGLNGYYDWVLGIEATTNQLVFTNSTKEGSPAVYEDTHALVKPLLKVA